MFAALMQLQGVLTTQHRENSLGNMVEGHTVGILRRALTPDAPGLALAQNDRLEKFVTMFSKLSK
jgi:hypothetical protein